MSPTIDLPLEDLQKILDKYVQPSIQISSVKEMDCIKTHFSKTICIWCGENTYLLRATISDQDKPSACSANTLLAQKAIINILRSKKPSPIPMPACLGFDTSKSFVPYPYILLSLSSSASSPPVALSQARQFITQAQSTKLDLNLGLYLHQLHEVMNDWFGTPAQEKDGIWSWQEAFTYLLEELLSYVETHQDDLDLTLPMATLRQCLSRAIGFFLFDDVEAPSLVCFTDDEDAILVEVPLENASEEAKIVGFVGWEHFLWGDPLMEALLREPSDATIEGYGEPLIVFPRQRTKKLWYTLYASLLTIVEGKGGETGIQSARILALKCSEKLKDAPCY